MGTVCYEAWKTLVKKVGGSQNGWLDLGHCLQIAKSDLDVSIFTNSTLNMFTYFCFPIVTFCGQETVW